MKNIAELLFEAGILKNIPRTGYQFLKSGKESVAEHSFMTAFIGFVMSRIETDVDALKLLSMCIVHDLAEARTGDLNYVNKKYCESDETKALKDTVGDLPFGKSITDLADEFNTGDSKEACLAYDADQLSFILELKSLSDLGYKQPEKWLPSVIERLRTDTGKELAKEIMKTEQDSWWYKSFADQPAE